MKSALLVLFLIAPSFVEAKARGRTDVTPVARNDGNTRIPFAVSCTSYTWTVLGSTKTTNANYSAGEYVSIRRRSLTVQTLGTVTYSVCIASSTDSTNPCVGLSPGYELGAPWGAVTIFDENLWHCRARDGGPTNVKGVDFYDNRDEVK